MGNSIVTAPPPREALRARLVSERASTRTAGAPLVGGNLVRLLKDAAQNYPAWQEAIESAREKIYFESFMIHEDDQGRQFARALAAKARAGVRVRVLYDWIGGVWSASRRFWQFMRAAGVEVRCFNPPRLESPLGWISRDHRKMIAVDGRIGFITGLCVGRMWVGNPSKGIEPWRDTGVEIQGPAVADIEGSFAEMWALAGPPLPEGELSDAKSIQPAGDVAVRLIASMPNTAGLYRLDQMVAADARETLWLSDAYFAGTTPYVQALRASAADGVDVRLLVPGASDLPVFSALSRAGYRPLLEAGVKVYEWNGPMMHAKTAVSDGRWARVGSTNLNLVSWMRNWELDLAVEDRDFGWQMEQMYLEDLENATQIILSAKRKPRPGIVGTKRSGVGRLDVRIRGRHAAAGAVRIGNVVGASITNHRMLGPAEAKIAALGGGTLLVVSSLAVFWPRVITWPLAVVTFWIAVSLFIRAVGLYRAGQQ